VIAAVAASCTEKTLDWFAQDNEGNVY